MREYVKDVVADISDSRIWKRHEFFNSPGWTMMHLIVEGELALSKLVDDYERKVKHPDNFFSGSDGQSTSGLSIRDMVDTFDDVYTRLDKEVSARLQQLREAPISDEELKVVLTKELDYYLHLLTTHLAMHCDALLKWRFASGLKSPYET